MAESDDVSSGLLNADNFADRLKVYLVIMKL